MPEIPSTVVIVLGALILLAGIGFGASRLLGGDESTSGGGGGNKASLACKPGDTQVAVLNGTGEPGLAAQSVPQLKQKGYDVGPVGNTDSPFDTSSVMFDADSQPCAAEIAPVVGLTATSAMDPEIRGIAEGANVAVVLGEDQVSGGSSTTTSTDSSSSGTLGN